MNAGTPWHSSSRDEVEALLETDSHGLSRSEAAARLAKCGPNELSEEAPSRRLATLLHQFTSPLVIVLVLAGIATAFLGEYVDTVVIAVVVVLNAAIGFLEEHRAERSVHALVQLVAPHARVIREHEEWEVESRELVPGDLILLESGARIPADVRLIVTTALQIDESALTGESVPVVKQPRQLPAAVPLADRTNLAFAGTVVASGRGRGYVVATGHQTELGTIAGAMHAVNRLATPFQERMGRLSRLIGIGVALCATLAFAIGLANGKPATELLLVAVAVAVSAVPEGLPIAVTVTLAVGVQRMAKRRAIVRHLPSVETLGSTSVIGSDKTGTLTENRMTVRAIWATGGSVELADAWDVSQPDAPKRSERADVTIADGHDLTLLAGVLTNEASVAREDGDWRIEGDPTEAALLISAIRLGIEPNEVREDYPLVAEIPFEPERQYSASIRGRDGALLVFVKGSPERVLGMCGAMLSQGNVVALEPDRVLAAVDSLARDGLRVLAFAYRTSPIPFDPNAPNEPCDLIFTGLQGLADPPRQGAREAIASCQRAGIRVVMITGDHAITACSIARELGIAEPEGRVLTGSDIETLDDEAFADVVEDVDVFARVAPEQKLRIVRSLQQRGEVVAVTGDGVNDAPALRAADIGIAMGKRGTDVAKEAADVVLADDNFASIAAAVEEGRITFANVRKVTAYLFATNLAELLTILIALALDWPLPLIAAQILWLNLVTDSLPVLALALEPGEPDTMAQPPRDRHDGVLSSYLWERVVLASVVMTVGTLGLFHWDLARSDSERHAQSVALMTMVLFQLLQAISMRSETRPIFRISPFSNPLLAIAITATLLVQVVSLYLEPTRRLLRVDPIDLSSWTRIVAVAAVLLVSVELHKRLRRQPYLPKKRSADRFRHGSVTRRRRLKTISPHGRT